VRTVLVALSSVLLTVTGAAAQDGQWHALSVPGGRATLRALGVDDTRERSAVMIELIRRLHFSTSAPVTLETAIRAIPTGHSRQPAASDEPPVPVVLPSPIAHAAWERVMGRALPPETLMRAILSDVPARLLFHGLAGLDGETRLWLAQETGLLRSIYRDLDAVKSFAMFAPAIEVSRGRVVIAGGSLAEARWTRALAVPPSEPRRFVSQLFLDRSGRTAGLYFLAATIESPRRLFILHATEPNGDERFVGLVETFAACYPRESNDYPFALRSNDPTMLLLGANVTRDGELLGPQPSTFWDVVFGDWSGLSPTVVRPLGTGPKLDAAAMVRRLCAAPSRDRGAVFGTLLAGGRVFPTVQAGHLADTAAALRVRRLFPAVFIAMERAGVRTASTFAAVGRHALLLDRLNDAQTSPAVLQQFQGALAMVLQAAASGTIAQGELARLLTRLADAHLAEGRYDGAVAAWFDRELLPAFGFVSGNVAEYMVARGLAGPSATPAVRVRWEDHDYVLDYTETMIERLMAVRQKQGGETLDRALELARAARNAAEVQAADAMLGQVLASWAYAPHLGGPDSGALVGGDGSRRHDLGLRDINRTRFEQRWALAVAPGDRGVVAGSYLGLEAVLAGWSLRRLSADTIPPQPTLGDNDRMSLFAMVSLSEADRVANGDPQRIASAIEAGQKQLSAALSDADRLESLARTAAISPWRRAALRWMLAEEPSRIPEQFPLTGLARIGGLDPSGIPGWGTSAIPFGCLCLAAPVDGAPELIAGRPVDGIVGTRSADLPMRVAQLLTELEMPAQLMPAVLAYAMRDYIDRLRPMHPADTDAFARPALLLTRTMVEDYLGAVAAVGPLRPLQ